MMAKRGVNAEQRRGHLAAPRKCSAVRDPYHEIWGLGTLDARRRRNAVIAWQVERIIEDTGDARERVCCRLFLGELRKIERAKPGSVVVRVARTGMGNGRVWVHEPELAPTGKLVQLIIRWGERWDRVLRICGDAEPVEPPDPPPARREQPIPWNELNIEHLGVEPGERRVRPPIEPQLPYVVIPKR